MREFDIEKLAELYAKNSARTMDALEFARQGDGDDGDDSYRVTFSSENPIRFELGSDFYIEEKLSHARGALDLKRLNKAGNLLFNHNIDDYIGVVEPGSARLEGKKGVADVRFSKKQRAQEIKADVDDKIIKGISVGYRVQKTKMTDIMNDEGKRIGVRVDITKWTPTEISAVTKPADINAAFQRSLDDLAEQYTNANESDTSETENRSEVIAMSDNNENKNEKQRDEATTAAELAKAGEAAVKADRERQRDLTAASDLAVKAGLPAGEAQKLEREAVASGSTPAEFQRALTAKMEEIGKEDIGALNPADKLDLDNKDRKRYSITKLVGVATGLIDEKEAGLEMECHRALSKDESTGSFRVPFDVLAPAAGEDRKRVVTTSNAADLVDETHAAQYYVENLRDTAQTLRAGVRMLPGLRGTVNIPRKTNSATFSFKAENATPSPDGTDLTFDNIPLTMKTAAGSVPFTREMIMNANPAIEGIVMSDLAMGAALAIDSAVLAGDGSANNPRGILNTTGINNTAAAGAITWAKMVELERLVEEDNALAGRLAYFVRPADKETMKTTLKSAGVSGYIMEGNTSNGYPVYTKTTTADLSVSSNPYILFGDFSQCLLGVYSLLSIQRDTATLASQGGVQVRAYVDIDTAVRHAVAFARHDTTA